MMNRKIILLPIAALFMLAACGGNGTSSGGLSLPSSSSTGDDSSSITSGDSSSTPVTGDAYKLGLWQQTLGDYIYFTGEMNGFYFATTTNWSEAIDVTVVDVEGGFTMQLPDDTYIAATVSGTHNNIVMQDDPFTWTMNEEYNAITGMCGENEVYIGNYQNYNTLSLSTMDHITGADTNLAELYAEEPSDPVLPTPDFTPLSEVIALENGERFVTHAYYLGRNDTVYNGTYNSVFVGDGSTHYQLYRVNEGLITSDFVVGETILEIEGTVANFTPDGSDVTTYEATVQELTVIDSAEGLTVPTATELNASNPEFAFTQENVNRRVHVSDATVVSKTADAQFGNVTITFTVGSSSTNYTLYLDSRYTDVEVAALANLKTGDTFETYTWAGTNRFQYVEGFSTEGGTVTPPDPTGDTYKLGVWQKTNNQYDYFTGEMNGFYFATTTNWSEAIDVTVAEVEGGFTMQLPDDTYIAAVPSGNFNNIVMQDDPFTWTMNEEYDAITGMCGENEVYIGTYQNYDTLSVSTMSHITDSGSCIAALYATEPEPPTVDTSRPEPVQISIADAVAETDISGTTLYQATGILEGLDHEDAYGNGFLVDPTTGATLELYGNTTTETAFTYADGLVVGYKNAKDAVTTLADINNGDQITIIFQYDFQYHNARAVTIAHETVSDSYDVIIPSEITGGEVTSSIESGVYGAEATLTVTPSSGYRISSVRVNHGYTIETLSEPYTFTLTSYNSVEVVFTDTSVVVNSITITTDTFANLGDYNDYTANVDINGTLVTLNANQIADFGNGLQFRNKNSNPSYIANTVALPRAIDSIEVHFNEGSGLPKGTNFGIAVGSSEVTGNPTGIDQSEIVDYTYTYDVTSSDATFFKVGHSAADSGSFYIDSIVINFVAA